MEEGFVGKKTIIFALLLLTLFLLPTFTTAGRLRETREDEKTAPCDQTTKSTIRQIDGGIWQTCDGNGTRKNRFCRSCEMKDRTINCVGLPIHAERNTATSVTQSWDRERLTRVPSIFGVYSETGSANECRFKCRDGYSRKNGVCKDTRRPDRPIAGSLCDPAVTPDITIGNYTIMACNIGAIAPGIDNLNNYGYYFQRGNNYGFPATGTVATSSTSVNASAYGPNTSNGYYYNSTFITNGSWDSSNNKNLRGGGSDAISNGWMGTNFLDRQGPCPAGYHVPSIGEWSGAVMMWWNNIGSGGSSVKIQNGLPNNFGDLSKVTAFRNYFKLPLSGRRYQNGSIADQGSIGRYFSSSPNGAYALYMFISSSVIHVAYFTDYETTRADSVRCFKNS